MFLKSCHIAEEHYQHETMPWSEHVYIHDVWACALLEAQITLLVV